MYESNRSRLSTIVVHECQCGDLFSWANIPGYKEMHSKWRLFDVLGRHFQKSRCETIKNGEKGNDVMENRSIHLKGSLTRESRWRYMVSFEKMNY